MRQYQQILYMPKQQQCQICFFPCLQLSYTKCNLCKNRYHNICYFQNQRQKRQYCDACENVMLQKAGKKTKREPQCIICFRSDGLLKQLSSSRFVHILCALTSNSIQIDSYTEFKVSERLGLDKKTCSVCKRESEHLIQCQLCLDCMHKQCLQQDQQYVGENLKRNMKCNRYLIDFLQQLKLQDEIFSEIKNYSLIKNKNSQSSPFRKLAVCKKEFKNYCWCFCGDFSLNDEKNNPSILCDNCNQYVHISCTGTNLKSPEQIKSYFCPDCKKGDKLKNLSKLPYLLKQMVRLEDESQILNIQDIRIIDGLPYIWSTKLRLKIQKSLKKAVQYLGLKIIYQIAEEGLAKEKKETVLSIVRLLIKDNRKSSGQVMKVFFDWVKVHDYNYTSLILEMQNILQNQQSVDSLLGSQGIGKNVMEQKRKSELIQQLKMLMQKTIYYLQNKPELHVGSLTNNICHIRKKMRKSNEIRNLVEGGLEENILNAILMFKCSSKYEQTLVQFFLNHFFCQEKISSGQFEQIKLLKKKDCPNFQVDKGWKLLQKKMAFSKEKSEQKEEQKKALSCFKAQANINLIISKILESKLLNPRLFVSIKKRVPLIEKLGPDQKKLRLLFQWVTISKKIHYGLEKRRITIKGVFETYKMVKKSGYPKNSLYFSLQRLHKLCTPIVDIRKRIEREKKKQPIEVQKKHISIENFIKKPSIRQVQEALRLIKEEKFHEVNSYLEMYQLQIQLKKVSQLRQKVQSYFFSLQDDGESNEQAYEEEDNQIEQAQNSLRKNNRRADCQKKKKKKHFTPKQVLQIKKEIEQAPINLLTIGQYYQLVAKANIAQTQDKNNKWLLHKQFEAQDEKQLIQNIQACLQNLQKEERFENCVIDDVFKRQFLWNRLVEEFSKLDQKKYSYFLKHIKRNKKWLQDLTNIDSGNTIITFEQLCSLQHKLKSSIFNHSNAINQILVPLKNKCLQASERLKKVVPYFGKMKHYIYMKENIFSPQSKLYKSINQLAVKDISVRVYQKDCQALKDLINLHNRVEKRSKQQIQSYFIEIESIYKKISIYFHSLKMFWQLIQKIIDKLILIYLQLKEQVDKQMKIRLLKKLRRVLKVIRFVFSQGQYSETIKRKIQQFEKTVSKQLDFNQYLEFESC